MGIRKGGKRKTVDAMTRKEWYDVVAPAVSGIEKDKRQFTKTLCNKTVALKRAEDNLKGRIFEVSLADLTSSSNEMAHGYRKMQFRVDHVVGRNCLTNFHGMSLTTDKLRSLLSKWCTLIEGSVEVKTSDGYTLRVFAIAFTKKRQLQVKKNCHCQTSHVKKIRTKMAEIITQTVSKSSLEKVVKNLQQDVMGDEIKKACAGIFPLRDVNIRKVKVVKVPKQSLDRLMEAHGGAEGVPKSVEGGRQKMADKPAEVEEADE
eukprot:TRINITY_DN68694_c0_g1_i1.p1 TRINITY_DN68694_c0_g1~~TRINITY_DN68694_c0_g1_i1.p1  ORF type:complete len:273 (+),score=59.49 TRINITY_DN68694_c0_g1_i1:41-820(+)